MFSFFPFPFLTSCVHLPKLTSFLPSRVFPFVLWKMVCLVVTKTTAQMRAGRRTSFIFQLSEKFCFLEGNLQIDAINSSLYLGVIIWNVPKVCIFIICLFAFSCLALAGIPMPRARGSVWGNYTDFRGVSCSCANFQNSLCQVVHFQHKMRQYPFN